MSDFVTVRIPSFLTHFSEQIEDLRDKILDKTAPILRKEEEASIRSRWYRTGATLGSLREQRVTEGPKKIYRLFPTTFYAIFGEFGTGRRGAQTGKPTPRSYRYGPKPGMTARRYSRIAVQQARPKVIETAQQVVNAYARNVTVK